MKSRSIPGPEQHWPLIAALVFLWTYLLANLLIVIRVNDGHFIYALDDPYIHMAIARNVVAHHVWGVTRYGFASCSSSPLWTILIIGVYSLFGISAAAPLVLGIASATACCVVAYLVMRSAGLSSGLIFAVLVMFVLLPSLPPLVFMGEEHVLHIALTIAFTYLASRAITREVDELDWPLILLSPFVVAVRYEGGFLLAGVTFLFLVRGRIRSALIVSSLGFGPIAIFGFWSMAHGWGFLPNSVLLNGNVPISFSLEAVAQFLEFAFENFTAAPWLLVLALTSAGLAGVMVKGEGFWTWRSVALVLVVLMIGGQIVLAQTGSTAYYRYDSFLVGVAIVFIATALSDRHVAEFLRSHMRVGIFGLALLAATTLPRAADFLMVLPRTTHNIYEQQYQMGRFVGRYYNHATVGLNDIGAVTYMTDIKVLDLVGLASMDVAVRRRAGTYAKSGLAEASKANRPELAIIYTDWFVSAVPPVELPDDWVKVGEWTISDPSIDLPTVTFYAISLAQAPRLRANLQAFTPELPKGVTVAFDDKAKRPISH